MFHAIHASDAIDCHVCFCPALIQFGARACVCVCVRVFPAVHESSGAVLPPLECLFTVEEEIGLKGAFALDGNLIHGRTMLNLVRLNMCSHLATCSRLLHDVKKWFGIRQLAEVSKASHEEKREARRDERERQRQGHRQGQRHRHRHGQRERQGEKMLASGCVASIIGCRGCRPELWPSCRLSCILQPSPRDNLSAKVTLRWVGKSDVCSVGVNNQIPPISPSPTDTLLKRSVPMSAFPRLLRRACFSRCPPCHDERSQTPQGHR